jgi:hypothetical protein
MSESGRPDRPGYPDWWSYPLTCSAGHRWAPGRVIVGWMPCDCPGAMREPGRGHLWVRCRAAGCDGIWYRPEHSAPEDSAPEDSAREDSAQEDSTQEHSTQEHSAPAELPRRRPARAGHGRYRSTNPAVAFRPSRRSPIAKMVPSRSTAAPDSWT